jgi:peroxiredoxin Q/BCP
MPVEAGTKAPDFELKDNEGKVHKLSDYKGKTFVLYFYPKDNTKGCTTEACSFRDSYAEFEKAGVDVIGVSPDDEKSHTKFIDKYELPFTLLSDPGHKVCEAYGVWGLKKFMGREYEGKIVKVFEKVKPTDHSLEVLEAVKA